VDLNKDGILNGRMITDEDFQKQGATLEPKPHNVAMNPKSFEKPEEALKTVIAEAGASLHRDAVDNRLIGFVKSLGKEGKIIKSEVEVGGQPNIPSVKGLKDSDSDGIPDSWEVAHKLNAANPADGNMITANGYSNLEIYFNELADKAKK